MPLSSKARRREWLSLLLVPTDCEQPYRLRELRPVAAVEEVDHQADDSQMKKPTR